MDYEFKNLKLINKFTNKEKSKKIFQYKMLIKLHLLKCQKKFMVHTFRMKYSIHQCIYYSYKKHTVFDIQCILYNISSYW